MTNVERAVYQLGLQDGRKSQGQEFTCGMTYPNSDLNELYDMGVNAGRAEGMGSDILMSSRWRK